jgi:hypothetical protein
MNTPELEVPVHMESEISRDGQNNAESSDSQTNPHPVLSDTQLNMLMDHLSSHRMDEFLSFLSGKPALLTRLIPYLPIDAIAPQAAPAASLTIPSAPRFIKIRAPDKYAGQLCKYNTWWFSMDLYLKNTMPAHELNTRIAVAVIGSYLEGKALNWFMANSDTLDSPTALFRKFESDHGIQDQMEIACGQIRALCNKHWPGTFEGYNEVFEPLATWGEKSMDAATLLNHYLYPLSQEIKNFFLMHPHSPTATWREAKVIISQWLARKDNLNRQPTPQLMQQIKTHQGAAALPHGPAPMEIGAVPTSPTAVAAASSKPAPNRPQTAKAMSAADYWKDKTCDACGLKGHGKKWRGCLKHPEYKPRPQSRTYASAVVSEHPTVAAAAGASTSAAATAAAAAPEEDLRAQLKDLQAMVQAMQSNF